VWAARKDARAKGRKKCGEQAVEAGLGCQDPAQAQLCTPVPNSSVGDERRLLILVDDDPDDLILFQRALRIAGVRDSVRSTDRGATALDLLLQLAPDMVGVCVVSDSKLLDMEGLELLEQVKRMVLPVPVKFVFLTGRVDPDLENRARAAGADAFYAKTCNTADLVGKALAIASLTTNLLPEPGRKTGATLPDK